MSEAVALVVLGGSLLAAIARWRWAPDWAVAAVGAGLLVAVGVLSTSGARSALRELGPTVGFLAALLVLADGCRRAGMFDALGAVMAGGSQGRPGRLLAMVFLVAAGTTAVLSLDATVVLLTPIVFATAARLRMNPRPHVYACSHLANSASLLLPVSNLTNLLAFRASGVSFTRFAALMVLPWLVALLIEWLVLRASFAGELRRPAARARRPEERAEMPWFALAVVALTLLGFVVSSPIGIAPVWVAAAGALVLALRERPRPLELVRAAEPGFLVFVLGLGIVVQGASQHGLSSAVDSLLPHGSGALALLAVAGISAVVANLLNNLPATLIILPVVTAGGPGAVLAMLLGVNIGPNLTYVGSLATLLWRRIVHAHDHETDMGEFTRLGLRTVPPILLLSTLALWLALQVV
jgi:arsenical pump membrane protein